MSDTNALSMLPSTRAAGQATMVEMNRAVTEVQGAIIVAQQCPRDQITARAVMLDSCQQPYLAERAFFRYNKGKIFNEETRQWEPNVISGPSIHLARELARIWGNIQYGVKELRRDDDAGESEMLAYAWDVQTNTRTETVFIVKHRRDKKTGPEKLTDLRDIYENNANAGARRVRECIYAVLPPWFTEQAKQQCIKTNEHGGGKPLPERISDMIEKFMQLGVRQEQLERKVGRKVGKWTGQDVALLTPVGRSLWNGETTVEEEFPTPQIDPADLEQTTVADPPPIQHPTPITPTSTSGDLVDVSPPEQDTPPDPEDWPDVVQPGTAPRKDPQP